MDPPAASLCTCIVGTVNTYGELHLRPPYAMRVNPNKDTTTLCIIINFWLETWPCPYNRYSWYIRSISSKETCCGIKRLLPTSGRYMVRIWGYREVSTVSAIWWQHVWVSVLYLNITCSRAMVPLTYLRLISWGPNELVASVLYLRIKVYLRMYTYDDYYSRAITVHVNMIIMRRDMVAYVHPYLDLHANVYCHLNERDHVISITAHSYLFGH